MTDTVTVIKYEGPIEGLDAALGVPGAEYELVPVGELHRLRAENSSLREHLTKAMAALEAGLSCIKE